MNKRILIVSPHLDDSVLSCGDLIYKFVENGDKVDVLTVFSGSEKKENLSDAAKTFHSNCFLDENSMIERKKEDFNAHKILGCNSLYLDKKECLYRKDEKGYLYPDLDNIYHLETDREQENLSDLTKELSKIVNEYDVVYAPLGLGNHADHLLVNKAINNFDIKGELYFYEEVAYVCYYYRDNKESNWGDGLKNKLIDISDFEYNKKMDAILQYKSQLHILWSNRIQMEDDLNSFSYKYKNGRSMRVWYYDYKK